MILVGCINKISKIICYYYNFNKYFLSTTFHAISIAVTRRVLEQPTKQSNNSFTSQVSNTQTQQRTNRTKCTTWPTSSKPPTPTIQHSSDATMLRVMLSESDKLTIAHHKATFYSAFPCVHICTVTAYIEHFQAR